MGMIEIPINQDKILLGTLILDYVPIVYPGWTGDYFL